MYWYHPAKPLMRLKETAMPIDFANAQST